MKVAISTLWLREGRHLNRRVAIGQCHEGVIALVFSNIAKLNFVFDLRKLGTCGPIVPPKSAYRFLTSLDFYERPEINRKLKIGPRHHSRAPGKKSCLRPRRLTKARASIQALLTSSTAREPGRTRGILRILLTSPKSRSYGP